MKFTYNQILKSIKHLGNAELYFIEKAINKEFVKRGFTDRLKLRELLE